MNSIIMYLRYNLYLVRPYIPSTLNIANLYYFLKYVRRDVTTFPAGCNLFIFSSTLFQVFWGRQSTMTYFQRRTFDLHMPE